MKIPTDGKLLRIFIGEADRANGKPLYAEIVALARAHGMAGATVVKGCMGFGRNSHMHTANLLRLSTDLPVIVEIVDSEEKIAAFLPLLDPLVTEGLATLEKAHVIFYRGGERS